MSSEDDDSWGNLDEYKTPPPVAKRGSATAPSAGTVHIDFEVDGSLLPNTAQSGGRVIVMSWNSLNRHSDTVPVVWRSGTDDTKSRTLRVSLPLQDEYEHAKLRRNGKADDAQFALGSLRTDSNVWFTTLVEEPSLMTNRAVYGQYGAGYVSVAELVEMSRSAAPLRAEVPLVLFDVPDGNNGLMKRATVRIKKVHFGDDTRALQRLASAQKLLTSEPSLFELNEHNMPLIESLTGAAISRHLYNITNNDNLKLQGTREINTRVVAPWYQTHQPFEQLNRLPIHGFFIDKSALNTLRSDAADDQTYLVNVFGYAARRRNMKLADIERIMSAQLERTDDAYDPRFTECLAVLARGFVLMSNTFDYQSDMHQMSDRAHRFAKDTAKTVNDESWKNAQLFGGGDCEDLAHYAYEHAQMLRRGNWTSSFLCTAQKALKLYVPVMMLGTVTSPALGNSHDANKSAAHLADAEHHHTVIRAAAGHRNVQDHMVRSDATRILHKMVVRGSPEDLALPVGGHSWMEMIPRHKFTELTRRLVPDQPAFAKDETMAPWRYFVPHMVLEGTGRINPLFMPSAYYAVPGQKRDALRRADLAHMRTHHALISNSPVFHGMQSEAQPTNTVNTPHERMTAFYVQSTQCFTDEFLHSTGCVAFNWFQLRPDAPVHEQTVDPLFDKEDALSADKIKMAEAAFVNSAAADLSKPRTAAETFNGVDHVGALKTLAVGALVGENIDMTCFEPAKFTLGVDLEQRLLDRPYASNIALLPVGTVEPLEAKAIASQLRQVCPAEKPSSRLRNFATDPALPIAYVRQSLHNENETDARAMARLVHNEKLVSEQRKYVSDVLTGVRNLFVNEPWLGRAAAAKRSLNLQTFYVSPCDLTSERAPSLIVNEVARFKQAGVVKMARAYVEEPTQNFQTLVLQLLCVEAENT